MVAQPEPCRCENRNSVPEPRYTPGPPHAPAGSCSLTGGSNGSRRAGAGPRSPSCSSPRWSSSPTERKPRSGSRRPRRPSVAADPNTEENWTCPHRDVDHRQPVLSRIEELERERASGRRSRPDASRLTDPVGLAGFEPALSAPPERRLEPSLATARSSEPFSSLPQIDTHRRAGRDRTEPSWSHFFRAPRRSRTFRVIWIGVPSNPYSSRSRRSMKRR